MERSESIKELATALSKAQGEIGFAMKDTANPFFKSKYADLASVVGTIREPLAKHGLSFTQVSHDSEHAACIETVIMHASGEWISTGKLTVPVSKHDAQGFGSAITYAKRYSLSAAFGVASDDDDGNAAAKASPGKLNSTITPTTGLWEALDEENRTFLTTVALDVVALIQEGKVESAVEHIKNQNLDADDMAALWTRFDSRQRSAMKKAAKPTAEEFASTP